MICGSSSRQPIRDSVFGSSNSVIHILSSIFPYLKYLTLVKYNASLWTCRMREKKTKQHAIWFWLTRSSDDFHCVQSLTNDKPKSTKWSNYKTNYTANLFLANEVCNEKQGLKSVLKLKSLQATNSLLFSSFRKETSWPRRVRPELKIGGREIARNFLLLAKEKFKNNVDVGRGGGG